jgi:hypothetical protein
MRLLTRALDLPDTLFTQSSVNRDRAIRSYSSVQEATRYLYLRTDRQSVDSQRAKSQPRWRGGGKHEHAHEGRLRTSVQPDFQA